MLEGRLREAHQHCLAILQQDRHHADAWFICALIAVRNGQRGKAAEIMQRAVSLDPDRAEYRAEQGKLLLALRRPQAALAAATAALSLQPHDPPTLNTLGTLLSHCGEHERALACFQRAAGQLAAAGPGNLSTSWLADFHFNFATSLQFAGDVAAARSHYEHAIGYAPAMFKAHSALASLGSHDAQHNHLRRLEGLRDAVRSASDRLHLGHALAREQEDLGLYDQALGSLQWGKAGLAGEVNHSIEEDRALFRAVTGAFAQQRFDHPTAGCDSEEPIFIVGMPRTGTTLVERMLGSHSRVFAAGEMQNLPLQVKAMTATGSEPVVDAETLSAASGLDMRALGEAYVASTRPRTGHSPRFTDKLPLNFFYVGLLRLALPRAKIICLRRDPMDTCLSNYRQLFATNFGYYHYNLDLLDCGRYYIEFDRLMAHWRALLPDGVLEVQYEDLVAAPERVCRALLDYCGLPWEDNCLSFQEQRTSVATPSAVQVRQGIYTTSVQRWRRYGDGLLPLYELLREAGLYD